MSSNIRLLLVVASQGGIDAVLGKAPDIFPPKALGYGARVYRGFYGDSSEGCGVKFWRCVRHALIVACIV
jgi:hypothetical protein